MTGGGNGLLLVLSDVKSDDKVSELPCLTSGALGAILTTNPFHNAMVKVGVGGWHTHDYA